MVNRFRERSQAFFGKKKMFNEFASFLSRGLMNESREGSERRAEKKKRKREEKRQRRSRRKRKNEEKTRLQ